MKVEVGIISHDPGALLERCLESLVRFPAGLEYKLVLQLTAGSNAENWNRLRSKMNGDLLCIMEDDTAVIRPNWLKSLVETMMIHEKCGILMPIETKDGETPDPGFEMWMNKTQIIEQSYGFCNLIRKEVKIEADEKMEYFVDSDLSFQARVLGWDVMCNGHVLMLHGGDDRLSTVNGIDEKQEKDKKYISDKWRPQVVGMKGEKRS